MKRDYDPWTGEWEEVEDDVFTGEQMLLIGSLKALNQQWTGVVRMGTDAGPRQFHALRGKGENTLGSNLTELCATRAMDNGFFSHSDWYGHVSRYMYAIRQVQKLSHSWREPLTVLDVGCGDMSLPTLMWRNRMPPEAVGSYWGLDLRANPSWWEGLGVKFPMTLVRTDLVQDDPTQLPGWPQEGFDLVVNFEVFEHVPKTHQRRLVENLMGWTKLGGTCLFSTPNAGVSDSTAANHLDPATGESREMAFEDKLALVTGVGFKVRDAYGTFGRSDRLPMDSLLKDPTIAIAKEYLPHAWFISFLCAAFPERSNNAIFHMVRP